MNNLIDNPAIPSTALADTPSIGINILGETDSAMPDVSWETANRFNVLRSTPLENMQMNSFTPSSLVVNDENGSIDSDFSFQSIIDFNMSLRRQNNGFVDITRLYNEYLRIWQSMQPLEEYNRINEAWCAAEQEIRNFENLKQGWDGDDGHAPTEIDMKNAIHVLNLCRNLTKIVPNIYPVGDGEIIISWKFEEKGYLEISLHEEYLIFISRTPDKVKKRGAYIYDGKIDPSLEEFIGEHLS